MRSSSSLLAKIALLSPLLALPGVDATWPKRGLASNEDIPIWQFGGEWLGNPSQVNWQYNWDSGTDQKQTFAEYVPMLWGLAADHTNSWWGNVDYWLSAGSGHLLAFNEPELASQSSLTPAAAAAGYRQYMQPYAGRASLGSPAVSNGGYSWMEQFLSACSDCEVDFLAIHWYNDHTLFSDLQSWVNSMCTLGNGRQVWITEFEAFGTIDEQSAFLKQAIPWLDNNSCVYRYAYFGAADPSTSLLQDGGPALSALGVQYTFTPYGQASM